MADLRASAIAPTTPQSSPTASLSIVVPVEAVDGDQALLEVESSNDTVNLTTPTGWTLMSGPDRVGTSASGWLFRKTMASDADVTVSLAFSTSQRCVARMSVYSDVSATGVLFAKRVETVAANSTTLPSLGSVPEGALVHASWLRRFGGTPAPDVTSPAGYSQGALARTATAYGSVPELSIEASYRVVPAAGTYGGETAPVSSNSVGVNYLVAFRGIVTDVTVSIPIARVSLNAPAGSFSIGSQVTLDVPPARVTALALAPDVTGGSVPVVEQPEQWPPEPYREAIRNGLRIWYTVDATLAGATVADDLRPTDGSITDTNRPGVRRSLGMSLADTTGDLFAKLTPAGTRLTVTANLRYTDRAVQTIPMGVFVVDSDRLSEGTGALSVSAPDKWVLIQRAKFLMPQNSNRGMRVVDQIAVLIRGALGPSEAVIITATSNAVMGQLTWDKDRDEAIIDLANEIGAWVYFDRDGVATIADQPRAGATAKWLIDASASGVLTDIDREQTTADAANVVVVESTASDEEKWPTVIVWDSDPLSPTYAGPDPLNRPDLAGPFGISVTFESSPNLETAAQAQEFGGAVLARSLGLASQVSLEEVPNPALDAYDVIDVLPPGQAPAGTTSIDGFGRGGFGESAFGEGGELFEVIYRSTREIERHIADTVTHPLTVGPAQRIEGRATSLAGPLIPPLPNEPDPTPDPDPLPDPDPTTTATIFGYNTNEGDTAAQTLAGRRTWWGRSPMVRRYNSGFVPATWPITTTVAPEKRVSYSFKADGTGSFTIAGVAAGAGNSRFRTFIESIPAGWTVYLTYYHEVNDDIREGRITPAQFKATYGHLYGQLQAARAANSLAAGTTVKLAANFMAYRLTDRPTYFDDSWVPSHSQMDLLTFDIYGNPGELGASATGTNTYGTATGPGYGTRYPLPAVRSQPMFDIINRLGWAQHWGILEVNTPARTWDTNEASRARWLKDMYALFLAQPYDPEVVLLWEAPSGVNWDQSFGRVAGSPNASVNALAPYIKGSP